MNYKQLLEEAITKTNIILHRWSQGDKKNHVNTLQGNSLFKTIMREIVEETSSNRNFLKYCNAIVDSGQISFVYMKKHCGNEIDDIVKSINCSKFKFQESLLDLSVIKNITFL